MIRIVTEKDHQVAFEFLLKEASMNLFILGDIEAFGYNTDFQNVWAEFDEQDNIIAIMLRYYQSFIVYSTGDFDTKAFSSIIKSHNQPFQLSGKSLTVERFEDFLKLGKKKTTHFAECRSLSEIPTSQSEEIKKATLKDVDRVVAMRRTISEFAVQENAVQQLSHAMKSNTSRTYFTEEDGAITSCVSTAAENSMSTMIVGVCTKVEYRNQGLATKIMEKLFKDVLSEGKILCLFYDNPNAGRIYKRLGFKDIGLWTMYQ